MKVLLIPLDYHRHTEDDMLFGDMLRAFQKQSEAIMYDGNTDNAISFKPDVIFFQGSVSVDDLQKIKSATGCKITMWTGDTRYAPQQSLMDYRNVIDIYLLPFSGETSNNFSKMLNKPCQFIFEPIQDWRFVPPKEMSDGRIVFVGNHYETAPAGETRTEIINFLKQHTANFEAYGSIANSNGSINYTLVPQLYNDSFIVIAENNWHDIEDYFTPRNLTAMSAGSCCLMRRFDGIEKHFSNFENCFFYRHKYELLDIVCFLKNNPSYRNAIAHKAYATAKEKYSLDVWVGDFIKITSSLIC